MKIDRLPLSTIPDTVTEKTDSTPTSPGTVVGETSQETAQTIRNPSPKTDSVELKTNSFFNFDNAAKLDSSKTNLAGTQVPATMLPGVPFREKVELPKNLPNGTSVDSGVASGDLGFGKTHTGPNHMGIDLKAGGTDIRNQLDDALKLKEGAGLQSSTPPAGGTVNYTGLAGKPGSSSGDSAVAGPRNQPTYNAGLNRPGMSLISADGKGNTTKDDLQGVVPEAGFLDRLFSSDKKEPSEAQKQIEERMNALKNKKPSTDGGTPTNQYTSPDAPEGTQPPVVTEETLEKVRLRRDSTTQPGVQEDLGQIDSSKLSTTDPRLALIGNPNPEDQSTVTAGDPHVKLGAKGPDTVNPRDPELGGSGGPINIDPNRPKP
jgi:hypothetical protein